MVRIVSDGTGAGTHVYTDDGEEIKSVVELTISKIRPEESVYATLKCFVTELDVQAEVEPGVIEARMDPATCGICQDANGLIGPVPIVACTSEAGCRCTLGEA